MAPHKHRVHQTPNGHSEKWHHDTQHNDILRKVTQHKWVICDMLYNDTRHKYTKHNNTTIMLNAIMLIAVFYLLLCRVLLSKVSLC
jgi:hypothetical protein